MHLISHNRRRPNHPQNGEGPFGECLPEGGSEHSRTAGEKKPRHRGRWIDGRYGAFLLLNTIAAKHDIGLAGREFLLIWTII